MQKTRERKQYLLWVEEIKMYIAISKKDVIALIELDKIKEETEDKNFINKYYSPIKK